MSWSVVLEERAGLIHEVGAIKRGAGAEGRDSLTPDELDEVRRKVERIRELNRP